MKFQDSLSEDDMSHICGELCGPTELLEHKAAEVALSKHRELMAMKAELVDINILVDFYFADSDCSLFTDHDGEAESDEGR